MPLTLMRQDHIRTEGSSIDDSLTPSDHDSSAVTLEDTVNYLASQLADILGETNWENAPDLSIATMAAKTWLDDKLGLRRLQHATASAPKDITVPSSQNYVVLSAASSEPPSRDAAFGSTTIGAVCAELGVGELGSHQLTEITGLTTLSPKNLCLIWDGSTGDPIESSNRQVYALLQIENGAVDGDPFDDTNNQGQLSFVRPNATYDDLEACPVADIETKVINYAYADREYLVNWSEQDWLQDFSLVDMAAAGVAISMDTAYDGGSVVAVDDTNVEFRLTDDKTFEVSDSSGTAKILQVQALSAGDEVEINGLLDLNGDLDGGSNKATFNSVEIGGAAGRVSSTTNLDLQAAADILFTTSRESGLALDDATAGAISALFGQSFASVSAAIKYAGEHGGVDLTIGVFVASSNYAQDANIPGGAGGLDISSPHSIDMNTPSGVDTIIFFNGQLMYGGNVTTQNDVYAGDTPANGDIKVDHPRGVRTGDILIAIQLTQ